MTITGHPHVGDVHRIRVLVLDADNVPVPLVGPIDLRLQRPSGTTLDVTAELVSDGSDGQAEYLTSESDFDEAGTWQIQLQDEDGPWHADTVRFLVLANLPEPA